MSEQTISTVNIGHLGNEAEVQLAEALVAVSEAVVAAAAEVDDNPRVVTVEETAHSSAEDAVLQQVGSLWALKLLSFRHLKMIFTDFFSFFSICLMPVVSVPPS